MSELVTEAYKDAHGKSVAAMKARSGALTHCIKQRLLLMCGLGERWKQREAGFAPGRSAN